MIRLINVVNNEYIGSFSEILELQGKGYTLLNDLKMAIEGKNRKRKTPKDKVVY